MSVDVVPSLETSLAIIDKCSERIRHIMANEYAPTSATANVIRAPQLHPDDILRIGQGSNPKTYLIDVSQQRYGQRWSYGASLYATKWLEETLPGVDKLRGGANGFRYKVASSWILCIVVAHAWKLDRVVFDDNETALHFAGLMAETVDICQQMANKHAFYRDGTLPENPKFIDHTDLPLRNHQRAGVALAQGQEIFAALMEMGTGKTPMSTNIMCQNARAFRKQRSYRVLILCPKAVRRNWVEEVSRFATTDGKVILLDGTRQKRAEVLLRLAAEREPKFAALITTCDTVTSTMDLFKAIPWDLIILDESQLIKSPYAKRGYKIHELRDHSKQRMILTGSLITNSPMDLYMQFEFLREGLSGFSSFNSFRRYYGKFETIDTPEGQRDIITGYEHLPFMRECIDMCGFVVLKRDVLKDLPKENHMLLEVDMTEQQKKLYKRVARSVQVEIDADMARYRSGSKINAKMTIENVLTRLLRLAQVTSGILKLDVNLESTEILAKIAAGEKINNEPIMLQPNNKLSTVMDVVKETPPDEKVVIWSCFVPLIYEFSREMTKAGIIHETYHGRRTIKQRDDAVIRFNGDPRCKVLLANQMAGGTGLNLLGYDWWNAKPELTTNVAHMFFVAQNWSVTQREQAQARSIRDGCRVPVTVYEVIVPGTIDSEIRTRVSTLRKQADELKDVQQIVDECLRYAASLGGSNA